jgi:hypothetical protein
MAPQPTPVNEVFAAGGAHGFATDRARWCRASAALSSRAAARATHSFQPCFCSILSAHDDGPAAAVSTMSAPRSLAVFLLTMSIACAGAAGLSRLRCSRRVASFEARAGTSASRNGETMIEVDRSRTGRNRDDAAVGGLQNRARRRTTNWRGEGYARMKCGDPWRSAPSRFDPRTHLFRLPLPRTVPPRVLAAPACCLRPACSHHSRERSERCPRWRRTRA